ncbi:DUF6049 family protein [Lysobacter korlensis]|uniref:DUF6049 family protein n=1 Tax=Lysobacter korlensis TaxID=553636 RepID=A0ABV6RTQ9_9GAMM
MSQRWLRASLALCLSVAGVGTAVDPAAAPPALAAAVEEAAPVATVTVAPAASGVVRPEQDLRVSVVITNTGTEPLPQGSARLLLGDDRLESSADIGAWLLPRDDASLPGGRALDEEDVPELDRGASTRAVAFTIPVDELEFLDGSPWGARPLWVEYRAGDADTVIGRTSVVWAPSDPAREAAFATAVPMTVPSTETGLIEADDLARYTSAAGLLTRQLDAVEGRPIAIGIDPMILVSIRVLGSAAPESAVDWLARLDAVPNETFPLAYGDTDLAAAAQSGGGVLTPQNFGFALDPALFPAAEPTPETDAPATPAPDATPSASAVPDPAAPTTTASPAPGEPDVPTTEELLAWDYTLEGIAWPADNTVVEGDLDTFAAAEGLTTTILAEGNVRAGSESTQAHGRIGDRSVLVADLLLSTLLRDAAAARTTEEWRSAVAALGAALAAVTTEHDGTPPLSLATLDRSRVSLQARAGETVAALDRLDWVDATSLSALLDRPARGTRLVDRPVDEDRLDAIRRLIVANGEEAEFATVAADPADITAPRRLRALALLSQSWRETPDAWIDQVAEFIDESAELRRSVRLVESSDLNINNELQRLPVSIANDLPVPVTVLVEVRSLSPQLHIEQSRVEIPVEANSAAREFVLPVRPLANGRATILISLSTPVGVPIGGATSLTLNVQADWGTPVAIGLGVLVVGLIAAGLYRTSRRNRRDRIRGIADD